MDLDSTITIRDLINATYAHPNGCDDGKRRFLIDEFDIDEGLIDELRDPVHHLPERVVAVVELALDHADARAWFDEEGNTLDMVSDLRSFIESALDTNDFGISCWPLAVYKTNENIASTIRAADGSPLDRARYGDIGDLPTISTRDIRVLLDDGILNRENDTDAPTA